MRSRKPRERQDWVYRHIVSDTDNAAVSRGGWSTSASTFDISSGIENAIATILYDSESFLRKVTGTAVISDALIGPTWPTVLAQAARAGGRRPTVHAVQGHLYCLPTAWTLGSRFFMKGRLGWFQQDIDTGQILLDLTYTVFGANITQEDSVAIWANDHVQHIHDFVAARSADVDGIRHLLVPVFWRGKRTAPSEDHCLAIFWEASPFGSNQTMRCFPQIRALMSDPNS